MNVWQERLLAFVIFIVLMSVLGWGAYYNSIMAPEWLSDIVVFGGFGCLFVYWLLARRRR